MLWEDNDVRYREGKNPFRIVLTYADMNVGTSGACYRATGAWYAGLTDAGSFGGIMNPLTGEHRHVRQGSRSLRRKDIPEGWIPFKKSPKLKYLYFLGEKKEQLKTMRRIKNSIKLQCRIGEYKAKADGHIVSSDIYNSFESSSTVGALKESGLRVDQCYESVYQLFGGRGTGKVKRRYIDHLVPASTI